MLHQYSDQGEPLPELHLDARLASSGLVLRELRAGDGGWIVHRHGVLYAEEYGWDQRFEALVARVVADFIERNDTARECAWVAEQDGRIVGSVFVARHSDHEARLHLLLVEPEVRGHGLGGRLIEQSLRFARKAGYRRMTLWTNEVLAAARHLYGKAGFQLLHAEPHARFGENMMGETWGREL